MPYRELPPLNALKAFAAAARLSGFRAAVGGVAGGKLGQYSHPFWRTVDLFADTREDVGGWLLIPKSER